MALMQWKILLFYSKWNGIKSKKTNIIYFSSQESQTNLYLCKNEQVKEKEKAGNQIHFFS